MSIEEALTPAVTEGKKDPLVALRVFEGIWTIAKSEDFEEFLKAVDVGITWRVLSSGSQPSVEFSIDGDEWTFKTHTLLNSHEVKFVLGKEFVETRLDGVKVHTTFTVENGKLVQRSRGDKEIMVVREVEGDDTLKATFTYKDLTAVRTYSRSKQITR